MSSIITSILSSTVGLLCNKARDKTAAKLKDGDITDEKIREMVVRELNDVKTKLDGLSRTDLLSSYSFLQEGVDLLNVSLDKSNEENAVQNEASGESHETSTEMLSGVDSGILSEALELTDSMGKLTIHSQEYNSAKKRFEEARKTATRAFCNEALSIKDRIFAAKLRIVSEILECLQYPETAITGCLSFLRKLHSLPAIREIFSVYLNGGVKSLLNKSERAENVKSVMLINDVLFQFVSKFSNKYCSSLAWPTIKLPDRNFYPIFNWREISRRKSMREELTQTPNGNELILDEEILIQYQLYAVNSHGEILVHVEFTDEIKVISKTGKSNVVKLPDIFRESEVSEIKGLAVDKNSNVYLVTYRTKDTIYFLHVLDKSYNVKHDCTLDFLERTGRFVPLRRLATNKNNDIVVIKRNHPRVYVCDNTGQLKHTFELDSACWPNSFCISNKNEIITPSDYGKTVDMYSTEEDVKSTIKLPEGHKVMKVAFHYVVSKIIVLSYFKEQCSCFLLCYSESGELETSTFFCKNTDGVFPDITSHPSGPVVVVLKRSITYI